VFEALVSSGAVTIDQDGASARALVAPHASGYVFRVVVGVTGDSVPEDWSAFDQRYQWFGKKPQAVASGAHLFVCCGPLAQCRSWPPSAFVPLPRSLRR
jgi:hypothetical protein